MNLFTLTSNDTPKSKSWFYVLIMLISTSLLLMAIFNAWVDPLFQYSYKADSIPHLKQSNTKLLPGLLKHYPHNGIVLGTSMVENMKPSMIKKHRNYDVINARISGGSAAKQSAILSYALQQKKIKYVLWGLDIFAFSGSKNTNINALPQYLYNEFLGDDYQYLLNIDTFKSSIKTIIGHNFGLWPENFNMDTITQRKSKHGYNHQATLIAWQKNDFNTDYSVQNYNFKMLQSMYQRYFKAIISNNTDIHFDIIFPPYSILAWKHIESNGWLQAALAFKRYVISELIKYPHVTIYDFQTDASITMNFNNYKDQTHYSPAISNFLLSKMNTDKYIIKDEQQLTRNILLLEAQTKNYDLQNFIEWRSELAKPSAITDLATENH